jgi:hypothetical protein
MHASDLNPNPDLTVPTIPVICDSCRAAGMAGDPLFSAIPDILDFAPVPRRAHVNNWTAEHQRAFIAALAMTGSPRQAARAMGRHAFGAEQLRKARGGAGFSAAWDAAMELARDREFARIHANLSDLAAAHEDSPPFQGRGRGGCEQNNHHIHPDCPYDPEIHTDDYPEYWEALRRTRARLTQARRLFLFLIRDDPDKRAAWETLVGPVDWARAERLEAQDDEPFFDPEFPERGSPNMRNPDMLLTAEAGLLPDFCGGHDTLAEIREAVEEAQGIGAQKPPPSRAPLP